MYVEDFLVVRLADFFATFLTDLRAVDFFAEERLADLAADFFAVFLAAFFTAFLGALRAVFFAATDLLLIFLYIAIGRLRFFKTS